MYICPLPLEPPHPTSHLTPLGQRRAWAELLVLYSGFPLAIYFIPEVSVWASQVTLVVKNPPANAGDIETQFWSLRQEDPLEEGMDTHSSILAWRIQWTEVPGRLQSTGSQRAGHDWCNWAHSTSSVYVSMLPSQFAPPSPTVSTNLFSMSASLFLPSK